MAVNYVGFRKCPLPMKNKAFPFWMMLSLNTVALTGTARAQDFPGCTLAFDTIKESHPLDSSCGAVGKTTSDATSLQNTAKHNFCATGSPVSLTFQTFANLKQAPEDPNIPFGSDQ